LKTEDEYSPVCGEEEEDGKQWYGKEKVSQHKMVRGAYPPIDAVAAAL
jgi:hypothetical protein